MAIGIVISTSSIVRQVVVESAYHRLHAARADFLRRLERRDAAASAYRDALALEMNAGDRAFLERRLAEVVRS